jgi:hypothetical protein
MISAKQLNPNREGVDAMTANQYSDLAISLQYLTSLVEAMQKAGTQQEAVTFQPEVAMVIQACVSLKLPFNVRYKDGKFDVVLIQMTHSHIAIKSDLSAYEMNDTTYKSHDMDINDVMKRIAGF